MSAGFVKYSICGFNIEFFYQHIAESKLHQPVNTHIHGVAQIWTAFPDISDHAPIEFELLSFLFKHLLFSLKPLNVSKILLFIENLFSNIPKFHHSN